MRLHIEVKMLLRLALLHALWACQTVTAEDDAAWDGIYEGQQQFAEDEAAGNVIYEGQQQFAFNMLKVVHKLQPVGGNVIFSPFSVYQALLLAYFVSANQTEKSIKKVLCLDEEQVKQNIMQGYRVTKDFQINRSDNITADYELSSANRLYVSKDQVVCNDMKQLFKDEIESVDYKYTDNATACINAWVENCTKNHITDLIPSGTLSPATQLVLVNAAYFKGEWKSKFQKTEKKDFHISNSETREVPMMWQNETFYHLDSQELGAAILELPYKGDEVSMFIMLPPINSTNGISDLLKKQNFAEVFFDVFFSFIPRPVEVSIPKFTNENTLELIPILDSLGIGDLFTSEADLSSLTGKSGISFNSAVHKAKIQVDEERTEAAAATTFTSRGGDSPPSPVVFNADHPFVYLLFHYPTNAILFVGIYSSPTDIITQSPITQI